MPRPIRTALVAAWLPWLICLSTCPATAQPADREGCCTVRAGVLVELRSPDFVFCLDASSGLRAQWWENRRTGRRITLGNGPELGADVGLPAGPVEPLEWEVVPASLDEGETPGHCVFTLKAKEPPLVARVTYRWNAVEPVLRKLVEIQNTGDQEVNRLLNVRLGDYRVEAAVSSRERALTTADPPPGIPKSYRPKPLQVNGTVPATAGGGLLIVTLEMSREGKPLAVRDVGSRFHAEGQLAGRNVAWQPVLGEATYPAPWQAWRIAVEPSPNAQPFQLEIATPYSSQAELTLKGHFIAD